MNSILIESHEIQADNSVFLTDYRAAHLREIIGVEGTEVLRVGVMHGGCGTGKVLENSPSGIRLALTIDQVAPASLGLHLILALPRPQMLKRILQFAATIGVDSVALIQTARVEKSFFQSVVLREAPQYFREGLEQGLRTVPPQLSVHRNFHRFLDEELGQIIPQNSNRVLCSLAATSYEAPLPSGSTALAIGPEGGFLDFEERLFVEKGFIPKKLSSSVLRVEHAVYYAAAQFEQLQQGAGKTRASSVCAL